MCEYHDHPDLASRAKPLKTLINLVGEAGMDVARELLFTRAMSFSHAVDRVRAHFNEMPGLELTVPQTVRLVGFGVDDCRFVIDSLVDAGFLRWTARRTIVRTDGAWSREPQSSYVSVRRHAERHTTVDSD
jgi:hypothetical protein